MSFIPTTEEIQALHRRYAPNDLVFERVYSHGKIVYEVAAWCVNHAKLQQVVDVDLLQAACLLHDIGTYVYFNDQGEITDERLYPQHALIGAKLVTDEGIDSRVAQCIETHILLGLTKEEIMQKPWPLPARDYLPESLEARLLCYADRFHTKLPIFNRYETFLGRLKERDPRQAEKFELWTKEFGLPDIDAMARQYNQDIR